MEAAHPIIIPPKETKPVKTGLVVAVPDGIYLRIASRSSMALQNINVGGGVVDNDFRGEIEVIIQNNSNIPFKIQTGQKIAQVIFEQAQTPCLILSDKLPPTPRGSKGFGSTTKNEARRLVAQNNIQKMISQTTQSNKKQKTLLDFLWSTTTEKRKTTEKQNNSPKQQIPEIHDSDNIENEYADDDISVQTETTSNLSNNNTTSDISSTKTQPVTQLQSEEDLNGDVPPILPNEKCNSSIPKHLTFSKDFVAQAIGYHKLNLLLKYFNRVAQPNITISASDKSKTLNDGETATLKSKKKNSRPSKIPEKYSDVWHMDIVYGPCVAIAGVKYALLLVDKKTRKCCLYALKDLKDSIKDALSQFILDVGTKPKLLRTDFDKKLIGGKIKQFLREKHIRLEAAPPKRQHQNGLVERKWQSIISMARNWLTAELLPTKYWFFAIKRAAEIMNILPTKHEGGIVSTPFEYVHNKKVDYRQLFPVFKKAYVKIETDESGGHRNKYKSQTIKTICVGSCPDSDGMLFYHPKTKKVITSADGYKFDTRLASGPQFNEKFDGDIDLTRCSDQPTHQTPAHEENTCCYVEKDGKYKKATVLKSPFDDETEKYTVQFGSNEIAEVLVKDIHHSDPTAPVNDKGEPVNHVYDWVQHGQKVMMLLPQHWTKPKQGYLYHDEATDEWSFVKGSKLTGEKFPLLNFVQTSESMIRNKKLFKGWKTRTTVVNARLCRALSNVVAHTITAKHVSAKNLIDMKAPTSLLKHLTMHPSDRTIWDSSYREEYEGLAHCNTYKIITNEEYQNMKSKIKGILPTMAIATIKTDREGNPVRAKYRIVALGNLDSHPWSKQDCFAPVLSQMELRLLISIAVRLKIIPKTGDVSQAFVQSLLPDGESYICRPPVGCPLTPKNCYWKLLKTLYGLKRSPRHWYETAKKILCDIGFKQSTHSPCIFVGNLIKHQPPAYLGLYVDDFIFFLQSKKAEEKFMHKFLQQIHCTFSTEIDYFLGIKFQCSKTKDNEVTIQLNQESYIENLLTHLNLHGKNINTPQTPYRSGYPVDTIPPKDYPLHTQEKLIKKMQFLIGSLNWIAISTRPDISTIVAFLSKFTHHPTQSHIDSAIRVVKYLKGTKHLSISFSTNANKTLSAFVNFPIQNDELTALTDANWGPQDQANPGPVKNKQNQLELFKTRSMSGYMVWVNGPIHWVVKRQTYTARSRNLCQR